MLPLMSVASADTGSASFLAALGDATPACRALGILESRETGQASKNGRVRNWLIARVQAWLASPRTQTFTVYSVS